MKKIISILLVMAVSLSVVSFVFASEEAPDWSDFVVWEEVPHTIRITQWDEEVMRPYSVPEDAEVFFNVYLDYEEESYHCVAYVEEDGSLRITYPIGGSGI